MRRDFFCLYRFISFPPLASGAEIFRRVLRLTSRYGAVPYAKKDTAFTRRNSLHTIAEKFLMRLQQKPESL
jgi:hypothetical protein